MKKHILKNIEELTIMYLSVFKKIMSTLFIVSALMNISVFTINISKADSENNIDLSLFTLNTAVAEDTEKNTDILTPVQIKEAKEEAATKAKADKEKIINTYNTCVDSVNAINNNPIKKQVEQIKCEETKRDKLYDHCKEVATNKSLIKNPLDDADDPRYTANLAQCVEEIGFANEDITRLREELTTKKDAIATKKTEKEAAIKTAKDNKKEACDTAYEELVVARKDQLPKIKEASKALQKNIKDIANHKTNLTEASSLLADTIYNSKKGFIEDIEGLRNTLDKNLKENIETKIDSLEGTIIELHDALNTQEDKKLNEAYEIRAAQDKLHKECFDSAYTNTQTRRNAYYTQLKTKTFKQKNLKKLFLTGKVQAKQFFINHFNKEFTKCSNNKGTLSEQKYQKDRQETNLKQTKNKTNLIKKQIDRAQAKIKKLNSKDKNLLIAKFKRKLEKKIVEQTRKIEKAMRASEKSIKTAFSEIDKLKKAQPTLMYELKLASNKPIDKTPNSQLCLKYKKAEAAEEEAEEESSSPFYTEDTNSDSTG